jgi:hypothetical protein
MNISTPTPNLPSSTPVAPDAKDSKLREKFDQFVGQTFFGQMMESMRKTTHKAAYFHGGRGEEVFQKQLDTTMADEMTKASANKFSGPMFQLFQLQRS